MIYTANFGNFDNSIEQIVPVIVYNEDNDPINVARTSLSPRLQAKAYKLMPLKSALPLDDDYAIWIDASATILRPDFENFMTDQCGDAPMMCFKHPEARDCIYEEAEYCKTWPKYTNQEIDKQVAFYRREHYPEHNGLFACGMVVYNMKVSTDAVRDAWWYQNVLYSYQDQISLPYVAWKHGVKVKALELNQLDNPYIRFNTSHNSNL